LRLTLSTFRDGSGQTILKKTGQSMPGFRDFERSLAAVLGGTTPENKGIFDVEVPTDGKPIGISCKTTAFQPVKNQCSFMEMSNSAAKFRAQLLFLKINWVTEPMLAGPAVIELISSWHAALEDEIDLAGSRYSVLHHDSKWVKFQLLSFPLDLRIADPKEDITWVPGDKALRGYIDYGDRVHKLWEFYPNSGGQVKYFPLLDWADWITPTFQLEEPPIVSPLVKTEEYFKALWPATDDQAPA
jgi:hypothetical protein